MRAGGGHHEPVHPVGEQVGEQERGQVVGLDRHLEAVDCDKWLQRDRAGVVGEHVDPVVRGPKLLGQSAYVVEDREVGPEQLRTLTGVLPYPLGGGLEAGRVPPDQYHLVATAGQVHGGGQSDAGAGPGHHHQSAPSEIFHRSIHPGHGARLPWRHNALWDR